MKRECEADRICCAQHILEVHQKFKVFGGRCFMIRNIITYVSIGAILFPDPITTVVGMGVLFLMVKFGNGKGNRERIQEQQNT